MVKPIQQLILTFDFVSTFTSAVMFLFLNDVDISAKKASPRFTALEVKAYRTPQHMHTNVSSQELLRKSPQQMSTFCFLSQLSCAICSQLSCGVWMAVPLTNPDWVVVEITNLWS